MVAERGRRDALRAVLAGTGSDVEREPRVDRTVGDGRGTTMDEEVHRSSGSDEPAPDEPGGSEGSIDRRLDQLLSRAEVQRLRSVLDQREDAVLSLNDADGNVLWATAPGARRIFGRDDDQYRGVHASAFLHPDDLPGWERAVARAAQGATVEWEGRVSTGSGAYVAVRVLMWRTQTGDEMLNVSFPLPTGR